MRSCSWMFAAVLVLGMALHGSASAAEGPAEDRAPAVPITFALGAPQCQTPPPAVGVEPMPPMFKQPADCTIPCVRDSDCTWVCPGPLAPGLCLLGCPNSPNSLRCVCVN
jgi:hypothetical protein